MKYHRFRNPGLLIFIALVLLLLLAVACRGAAPPTAAPTPLAQPTSTPAADSSTPVPVAQATPTNPPPGGAMHHPSGELRVAMATFGTERFNPGSTAASEDTVQNPFFENLLALHPDTGENLGELAESWEVRDGGRICLPKESLNV